MEMDRTVKQEKNDVTVTAFEKAIVERSLYKMPTGLLSKAFGVLIADNMRSANVIFGPKPSVDPCFRLFSAKWIYRFAL